MITYARETFDQAVDDVKALLPIHWREMALLQEEIPLDPEWESYRKAFAMDLCRIYTVRDDAALAGYVIFLVTGRNWHYNHRWAKDDTIWLHPDHRNMGVGNGLFDFFEADLRKDGPIVIQIETRAMHPALNFLCKSRGYYETGMLYGKRFA